MLHTVKSGLLLINKPVDWTSFDVVKKTQNILKTKKIGHIGTLDPFATGLLILLVNKATKLSESLTNQNKEYIAKCQFGLSSNTGDPTGEIIHHQLVNPISKDMFLSKIPEIIKIDKQVPPKFSAIKINGKKAYQLARKNIDFDLLERQIKILDFELLNFDFPHFTYRALVTKGTYIRSFTEQIAKLFDNNAVTIELCRTKIGNFDLQNSITINEISEEKIIEFESRSEFQIPNSKFPPQRPVLTIGSFDGVHIGHQFLLQETQKIAKQLNTYPIVLTFDKHPNKILKTEVQPFLLTEYDKREKLIKDSGICFIVCMNFDRDMSLMHPSTFLKKLVIEKYNPKAIVVGYDSHFGKDRTGNIELLNQYSDEYNYQVIQIPQFLVNGVLPKSSIIRDLIKEGNVDTAKMYLGRTYSIKGSVVRGKQIGRKLGYPTINIYPTEPHKLIPQQGVYATQVLIENKLYNSATNIGTAPTIKTEKKIEIESFIFDFNDEVYNQEVELFFLKKLRNERQFANQNELIKQITTDIQTIKNILCTTNY